MNIYEKIVEENRGYEGTAVIEGERSWTYPELFRTVGELVPLLKAHGARKHSRIAVLMEDSFDCIAFSLAVLAMDAIMIPVSSRSAEPERKELLKLTGVNLLIADRRFCGEDAHPEERSGTGKSFPFPGRPEIFLSLLDETVRPVPLPEGKQAAFIRFSSGTTGRSKGVVLSHHSVLERTSACTELDVRRGESVLWVLDMAFHFVVTILLFLRRGAQIVICGKPTETEMFKAFRSQEISMLYATPYHYLLMCHSPDFRQEDLRTVRRAFSTAMKLETTLADAFREKFSLPLTQAYGIIEVGLPCVNVSDEREKMQSVGRLQKAYRLRIADADERGTGRILLAGPGFFDAYLVPFQTREELCPGGWFDTGDTGHLDREGFLFIEGRTKDIINFSGMKIFPYEVEEVLLGCPGISDVRVYAFPMEGFGEVPSADVVLSGTLVSEDWENRIRTFASTRLPGWKIPVRFRKVDVIPRTASGKTIRHSL